MNKCWFLLAVALALAGCGKKTESSPLVAPPTAPTAKPLDGKVDLQLTAMLKQFVSEKGRLPSSILELAGAKAESLPRPPDGFTYAIDGATTEVKLVKE